MLKYLQPHHIETIKALAERLREKFPPQPGRMYSTLDIGEGWRRTHDDITHHALYMQLDFLPRRVMAELKALIWLGRGDYDAFRPALRRAKESAGRGDVPYVLEKFAELSDYLKAGEAILGRSS